MLAQSLEVPQSAGGAAPPASSSERALQIIIIISMTAAILSSSYAVAFWGSSTGLILPFAAAWLLAWFASQNPQHLAVYSFLPLAFCTVILTYCIISPLPGAEIEGLRATDRLNYYDIYYAPDALFFIEYEIGFRIIVYTMHRIVEFPVFLSLCAGVSLMGYLRIFSSLYSERYFPLFLCFCMGYFAFWSGVLNVTRQFLAGGVMMLGVGLLLRQAYPTTRRHIQCALLGLAAMLIHGSAAILFAFQLLLMVRQRDRLLLAMWAFNFSIFALNYYGLAPLRPITSRISGFSRYDTDQLSAADLSSILTTGVGTGNRLDWAAFLLSPMLLYWLYRGMQRKGPTELQELNVLALFYTTMTIPFFAMSYLIYADRLAYYGFLILPLFIVIIAATPAMKAYRIPILFAMGFIAISQFGLGWYGYSPLHWSGGLIWAG